MELSIFIAKIIALIYLAAGVAALRGVIDFNKIIDDYNKSPAFIFMSGLFALIMGMIVIRYHNIWVKDWTVLITLFGWAAAVKGVLFIAFPDALKFFQGKFFKGMYKNTGIWGVLLLLISALFGYFGFIL